MEAQQRKREEHEMCKQNVKNLREEGKERVEDFGGKLNEKFEENKKLWWKEVKKERSGFRSGQVIGKVRKGSC